ncbi:MAG: hypothetical protein RL757_536 [Bacteroidota bacterium]|jgi:putative membrane protein
MMLLKLKNWFKNVSPSAALWFLGIFYVVGIFGFLLDIDPRFPKLTPLNLLLSLTVAVVMQARWTVSTVSVLIFAGIYGFLIEVLGVSTTKIFGTYWYGDTLGLKIFETPISMAINWALTTYCATMTVNELYETQPIFKKTILAAILMVSLDVLIEPVAIRYDFWAWQNNEVPMQNYLGWFLVSVPLQFLMFALFRKTKNVTAFGILLLQFAFFSILNLFIA